jgi:hypothetical protein
MQWPQTICRQRYSLLRRPLAPSRPPISRKTLTRRNSLVCPSIYRRATPDPLTLAGLASCLAWKLKVVEENVLALIKGTPSHTHSTAPLAVPSRCLHVLHRAQRATARTMAANHQNHDSLLEAQPAQTSRELYPPENPLGEGMSQLNDTVDGPMMDPQSSDPTGSASRISARSSRRKGRAEEGSTRQSHSETIESSNLAPVQNPPTSIVSCSLPDEHRLTTFRHRPITTIVPLVAP